MNEIGRRGEQIAQQYLRQNGFQIVTTNWSDGRGVHCRGEIDIVAQKNGAYYFVEVKCRANDSSFGDFSPESAFDSRKIEKFKRAATSFLRQNRVETDFYFTLIAINLLQNGGSDLRIYENILL